MDQQRTRSDYEIYKSGSLNAETFLEIPNNFAIPWFRRAAFANSGTFLRKNPILKNNAKKFGLNSVKYFVNAYFNIKIIKFDEDKPTDFLENISKIRSSAIEILDSSNKIIKDFDLFERSRGLGDVSRIGKFFALCDALNSQWRPIVHQEAYVQRTYCRYGDSWDGIREYRHAFSSLSKVVEKCDEILMEPRDKRASASSQSRAKMAGRVRDLDREAFLADLGRLYEAVFEMAPSAAAASNGKSSPFMRFVLAIFHDLKHLADTHGFPSQLFHAPSAGTVASAIKLRK